MSSEFVDHLYRALSKDRLEAYRPPDGADIDMLTNYFWNIDLIEALVPCMHAVELALRNSIHSALTDRYGTDMWFYQPGLLDSNELVQLGRALQYTARNPPLLAGKIVAALNFGFWVSLLAGRYERRFWQPERYQLKETVFPNAAAFSQQQIAHRFDEILKLRNRCFHHEGIWFRANLPQEHSDIHDAIEWINPTLQIAILAVDNFPAVYNGRAAVEAGLKHHLGIASPACLSSERG